MELFAYQTAGRDWLASRNRALLWDEQGVGKSAQIISAADKVGALDVLVICPAGVRAHWVAEWRRWQKVERKIAAPVKAAEFGQHPSGVLIVSYEGATARQTLLAQRRWDCVIIDEHHYLKSHTAARTKAILGRGEGIIHSTKRVWALSGTPMPNSPEELWTILATICPEAIIDGNTGKVLSRWQYIYQYCNVVQTRYAKEIKGGKNLGELAKCLQPHVLRRKKAQVLSDLPPMVWGTMELDIDLGLDSDDERLQSLLKVAAALDAQGGDAKGATLDNIEAEHIARALRFLGTLKAPVVADLVADELEGGAQKIIIGYWHQDVGDVLAKRLAEYGCVRVDGSSTPKARAAAIDAFQTLPGVRVFLGQIKAAGTGINLTAASQVVMAEQSWVPGDNAQFSSRPHRVGQKNSVLVRVPVVPGSLDERVSGVLARKTQDIGAVVDGATNQ